MVLIKIDLKDSLFYSPKYSNTLFLKCWPLSLKFLKSFPLGLPGENKIFDESFRFFKSP